MGITESFCRLLTEITVASIPPAAIIAARRLILDGIAVAVAGSRENAPRILADHLHELGAAEQATAIGFGFRTSTVSAAYLNGAAMHVLDYEPMWAPPNHAISTTLPAVLALAETTEANGIELITALIKGLEAQGRLRVASRQYEPRELVFHPPGVVGVIGSAIASAHLLGLDVTQTRNAVGLAASRAGTLIGNIGTMAKCSHCGLAAAMGLDAALMARRGFTANPDIIEAPNGLAEAFFNSNWDPQALVITGVPLRVIEPGYAIKMFPSQYATHFVILAALAARARIPAVQAIKTVQIIGPVMPYVDRRRPSTGLESKFSFQYAAACALLDSKIGIGSFTDERCAGADIAAMLPKVRLVQSPEIPALLDRMWVDINVELLSGGRIIERCAKPNGAWGKPIPEDEHLAKVRDCMGTVFDVATIENCVSGVQHFDTLESPAVRRLLHSLGDFDASADGVSRNMIK
jgi:2-methylcitrate dehydratase PrpD